MMTTISGTSKLVYDLSNTDAADIGQPSDPIGITRQATWTTSNADRIYRETISLNGAVVNRDLFGSLTDAFGNTVNFATVRELTILNRSVVAGESLLVYGNFVTGALLSGVVDDAVKLIVGPGQTVNGVVEPGRLHFTNHVDGFTVTDTTQERITLDPGAKTFDVELIIIGKE